VPRPLDLERSGDDDRLGSREVRLQARAACCEVIVLAPWPGDEIADRSGGLETGGVDR
jgi:hypothetical protein